MLYCPPNITITTLWVDDGISECFLSTLSVTITGVFIILFGSIQLYMYHKYGTPVEIDFLPNSPLYYLQLFITFALCALVLLRFLLQIILLDPGVLYGYMVIILVILFKLICNFSWYIFQVNLHFCHFYSSNFLVNTFKPVSCSVNNLKS